MADLTPFRKLAKRLRKIGSVQRSYASETRQECERNKSIGDAYTDAAVLLEAAIAEAENGAS